MIIIPRGYLRGRRFPAFDRRMPLILEPGPWQPPEIMHYGNINWNNDVGIAVPVNRAWLESIIGEITSHNLPVNGYRVMPLVVRSHYSLGYTFSNTWPLFFSGRDVFNADGIGKTAKYDRYSQFLSEVASTVIGIGTNILYDPTSPYGIYGIDSSGYLTLSPDGRGDRLSVLYNNDHWSLRISTAERSPEWLCLYAPFYRGFGGNWGAYNPETTDEEVKMNPVVVLKSVNADRYGVGTHELVSIEDVTIDLKNTDVEFWPKLLMEVNT